MVIYAPEFTSQNFGNGKLIRWYKNGFLWSPSIHTPSQTEILGNTLKKEFHYEGLLHRDYDLPAVLKYRILRYDIHGDHELELVEQIWYTRGKINRTSKEYGLTNPAVIKKCCHSSIDNIPDEQVKNCNGYIHMWYEDGEISRTDRNENGDLLPAVDIAGCPYGAKRFPKITPFYKKEWKVNGGYVLRKNKEPSFITPEVDAWYYLSSYYSPTIDIPSSIRYKTDKQGHRLEVISKTYQRFHIKYDYTTLKECIDETIKQFQIDENKVSEIMEQDPKFKLLFFDVNLF